MPERPGMSFNSVQDHLFLLNNVVIWSIFVTAFLCYGLLIELCFVRHRDDSWFERTRFWTSGIRHMLAALPLLGLLGTISGLLKTFQRMSIEQGFSLQEVITGGIAEAMFTTQLGLLMVIPGLLMLAFLDHRKKEWLLRKAHEVTH